MPLKWTYKSRLFFVFTVWRGCNAQVAFEGPRKIAYKIFQNLIFHRNDISLVCGRHAPGKCISISQRRQKSVLKTQNVICLQLYRAQDDFEESRKVENKNFQNLIFHMNDIWVVCGWCAAGKCTNTSQRRQKSVLKPKISLKNMIFVLSETILTAKIELLKIISMVSAVCDATNKSCNSHITRLCQCVPPTNFLCR